MKKRIIVWLITFCMTMGCFSSAYAEESTDGAVSEFTEVSDAEAADTADEVTAETEETEIVPADIAEPALQDETVSEPVQDKDNDSAEDPMEDSSSEEDLTAEPETAVPVTVDTPEEEIVIASEEAGEEEAHKVKAAVASGTCGSNLTWEISEDGVLTISGTGPMDDYENNSHWGCGNDAIKSAVIRDGCTSIGDHAFGNCGNLTSIWIADSVSDMGENAFSGCDALQEVYFAGSPEQWAAITGNSLAGNTDITVRYDYFYPFSDFTLSQEVYDYDGTEKRPEVTVTHDGQTLTEETDYTLLYMNNIEAGTATVIVTGTGNYSGMMSRTFVINTVSLEGAAVSLPSHFTSYNGNEHRPNPTVSLNGQTLTAGRDYTVDYTDNVNAGMAWIIITGAGSCTGEVRKSFMITPARIQDATVTNIHDAVYTGSPVYQSPIVKLGGKTLLAGTDYRVGYTANILPGSVSMLIQGEGNYTGIIRRNFYINPAPIDDMEAALSQTEYTYDGTAKEPAVTIEGLTAGTDFTVAYANNTDAGTAAVTVTGKGNYTGTIGKSFVVYPASIEEAVITNIHDAEYTGNSFVQSPVLTIGEKALTAGTDYTISDSDRTDVGTATLTIYGKGNYSGVIKVDFEITPVPLEDVSLGYTATEYDGTEKTQDEVLVTAIVAGEQKALTADRDYSIAYENNINIGTASVIVTGSGNYTGSITKTFEIVPAPDIPVTKIKLNKHNAELATGATLQLKATITPANATDPTVTWTSSDPKLVTVDPNGKVKAKKYGKVTVTAKTANGKKDTCEIQTRFSDVNNPKKSYYDAVYWAVDNGITKCSTTFKPDNTVTRGEFVAFIWRMAGMPGSSAELSFTDVNSDTQFYAAIRWAVGKGIIKGYKDKTFRSANGVTRGEAAIMLWRWAGKPEPLTQKSPFSDVKPSGADSYKAILWGSENGIINGSGGKFMKDDGCTRAQIVTFLHRYHNLISN